MRLKINQYGQIYLIVIRDPLIKFRHHQNSASNTYVEKNLDSENNYFHFLFPNPTGKILFI